jgi:hypothetical protein
VHSDQVMYRTPSADLAKCSGVNLVCSSLYDKAEYKLKLDSDSGRPEYPAYLCGFVTRRNEKCHASLRNYASGS